MKQNYQSGQILLLALILMLVVLTFVVSMVSYAQIQVHAHRQALNRESALDIAEAGEELAIWKLNNQSGYTGETATSYAGGVYNVTITSLSGSSKLIKVDSYIPNASNPIAHRTVQITATVGTTNIGFNYGVQVGNGGLSMSNSSQIIGNVYANGNVDGSNSAKITGTAIVAGASGTIDGMEVDSNATAHTISNTDVGGNVNAVSYSGGTVTGNATVDTLSSCTINGNATYDSKSSCTVKGTSTTPNPTTFTDPSTQPLPIDQSQIDDWTTEAANGGVVGSKSLSSGTTSLGPIEINGNLTVSNSATLIITGTIWVTGSISFSNNAAIKLSPSFGAQSGVIIAGTSGSSTAGAITISNSATISGSGTSGSYVLVLSQMNGDTNTAISSSNSGAAGILYAGTGKVSLSNSGNYKEITADLLDVNNSATVTYETGLASTEFSSGPSGGWQLLQQSWQLLQ